MKKIVLLSILLLFSCNNKHTNLYEGNFYDVMKIADSLDKNVWMILGGGNLCAPCNRIIEDMTQNKIFEKYADDFIFYKCNTNNRDNLFLQHIFLMTTIPNSYIINREREVVSYLLNDAEESQIEKQLEVFLKGTPRVEVFHTQFKSRGKVLLKMQNLLLKSTFPDVDESEAMVLIDSSISVEPFFYNLFTKYKLLDKLGLKNEADSCANLALSYLTGSYQIAVYDDFVKMIKNVNPIYQSENKEFPDICFQDSVMDCGHLEIKTVTPLVFKYKNIGTKPLVVIDVLLSCGCTQAEWSKKPLMPGDSSQIIINYDADVKGDFYRTATIVTNSRNNVKTVFLKGVIK